MDDVNTPRAIPAHSPLVVSAEIAKMSPAQGTGSNGQNQTTRDACGMAEADAVRDLAESRPIYGFPTPYGTVVVDPDGFIEDVCNAVNDLAFEGFSSMDEFAAQALNLKSEEARIALTQNVDSIYCQVQDSIDEQLNRWESICRDCYFNFPAEAQIIVDSKNKDADNGEKVCKMSDREEGIEMEALDAELVSLRSQLIAADRAGSKMLRELTSLQKQLELRREVVANVDPFENFDPAMLEDVIKSARLLVDTMVKASRLQDRMYRHQTSTPRVEDGKDEVMEKIQTDDLNCGDTEVINLLG